MSQGICYRKLMAKKRKELKEEKVHSRGKKETRTNKRDKGKEKQQSSNIISKLGKSRFSNMMLRVPFRGSFFGGPKCNAKQSGNSRSNMWLFSHAFLETTVKRFADIQLARTTMRRRWRRRLTDAARPECPTKRHERAQTTVYPWFGP
jgi:hypothetical protein